MITRDEAIILLNKNIKSPHLINHSLSVEAVMRSLAKHFNEDEEIWSICGLLHDLDADIIDYEKDGNLHGIKTIKILKENNFDNEDIFHAILAHNKLTNTNKESVLDKALYAADPITGFITAVTLVRPSKKIEDVSIKSVTKKIKDKAFAAGADREGMKSIIDLGLEFNEFVDISLNAMKEISQEIGL